MQAVPSLGIHHLGYAPAFLGRKAGWAGGLTIRDRDRPR